MKRSEVLPLLDEGVRSLIEGREVSEEPGRMKNEGMRILVWEQSLEISTSTEAEDSAKVG
jgi:hypothetical protein